jgi:hypothetical protein
MLRLAGLCPLRQRACSKSKPRQVDNHPDRCDRQKDRRGAPGGALAWLFAEGNDKQVKRQGGLDLTCLDGPIRRD